MSTPVSKLPQFGTTIFTVMSKLALQHQAINLSQGFPDFEADPRLIDLVHEAMRNGQNQYAPMPGVPELADAISKKIKTTYGWAPNPETEITITAGGTQAIYSIIGAIVREGDEVIVLEPCYDSYIPSVISFGGVVKPVALHAPDYHVDWDEVKSHISPKTKMIMINTPHNPCGAVLGDEDMIMLQSLVTQHDLWVLSDEVYEHLIFDQKTHYSVLRYPALYSRSFAVYSFGKSLHVTGWKTGYVIAPPALTKELRKIHQFNVFSGNRPMQWAIAQYMERYGDFPALAPFYQQKRDTFLQLMEGLPLHFLPCHGSYFILADYSAVSDLPDLEFVKKLTIEGGVATIPLSPFYQEGSEDKIVRFCFAKKEQTLQEAADRMQKFFS